MGLGAETTASKIVGRGLTITDRCCRHKRDASVVGSQRTTYRIRTSPIARKTIGVDDPPFIRSVLRRAL